MCVKYISIQALLNYIMVRLSENNVNSSIDINTFLNRIDAEQPDIKSSAYGFWYIFIFGNSFRYTVEPLTNDHPHQRPSLSYDHIACDGKWFL